MRSVVPGDEGPGRAGARSGVVLVWDREAGIGGTGRPTAAAAAFAGSLAARTVLAPRRDPEFKGIVVRGNGYLETSFRRAAGSAARKISTSRSPIG